MHSADKLFLDALYRGIRKGRNGKGSIYIFPAGNGGCIYQASGTCIEENSNFDAYVNNIAVITACAVDDQGLQPFYGERGANLLVCAPSSNYSDQNAITTLKVQGGTRTDFGGTSASTPMVSGVVALMLSANPNLTWRDVKLILAKTARKNSPTDSGWVSGPNGLNYNDKFGFGVVNAKAAVDAAKTWQSVGDFSGLLSCDIGTQTANLTIADLGSQTASFNVNCPQIGKIEFVEVTFKSSHDDGSDPKSYAGDLKIELTSPAGKVSELATPRVCKLNGTNVTTACGQYNDWKFGSVRHLDEAASGTWKLKVSDVLVEGTGVWKTWGLRIHGRP